MNRSLCPAVSSRLLLRTLSLCCAALFSTLFCRPELVSAQQQRKIVLSQNQFQESFLEKVTVSGGIRAGFMQQSLLSKVDLEQLYIHVLRDIEEPSAMLCVNMVSRDGRYAASWQYDLGKQTAGLLQIEIPSKYQEKISSYTPDSLVILAAISQQDCATGNLKYLPASWGPANDRNYLLYINSGNTETSTGIPGMAERGTCTKISADSTIAYDTTCTVNKELLATPRSIFVLRNNFGNRLPNVEFPLQ